MLLGSKAWRSAVGDSHEDQRLAQIIAFQSFRRWAIVREPNGVPMGLLNGEQETGRGAAGFAGVTTPFPT